MEVFVLGLISEPGFEETGLFNLAGRECNKCGFKEEALANFFTVVTYFQCSHQSSKFACELEKIVTGTPQLGYDMKLLATLVLLFLPLLPSHQRTLEHLLLFNSSSHLTLPRVQLLCVRRDIPKATKS